MSMVSSSEGESESVSDISCDIKIGLKNLKDSSFCPFKLEWVFGFNSAVPIVNLTTKNRTLIVYACSHVAVLYDYRSKEIFTLQGHKNDLRTLSTNADGKWLLSADFGNDSVVVIWDTQKYIPVCTLFNPHGEVGMTAAKISYDAKYVVTVGNEKCQILKFWLWTCGQDTPDASIELKAMKRDRVKEISFNENNSDQFILTLEHHVLFIMWEKKSLHVHHPHIRKKRDSGILNNSIYLSEGTRAITSTSNGFILMWSYPLAKSNLKDGTKNKMQFVKGTHLEKSDITQIARHNDIIVLGTAQGHLNFYDEDLKLLYWCHECHFDSIRSISFDLPSEYKAPKLSQQAPEVIKSIDGESENLENESDKDNFYGKNEDESSTESESENETIISQHVNYQPEENLEEIESNITYNIEYLSKNKSVNRKKNSVNYGTNKEDCQSNSSRPTDATMGKKVFDIGKFFVCTKLGRLAWLDISRLKFRFILHPSESVVTALDIHSDLSYIVMGNSSGFVRLFNYTNHLLMVSKKTPPLPNFNGIYNKETINFNITHVSTFKTHEILKAITALKYSPKSDMLACGLESGVMWILHPDTLDPLDETPFKHSTEAILNITFSDNSIYMAYSDNAMMVAVFKKAGKNHPLGFWNFIGKYHSHYSPIREILFEPVTDNSKTPRFFSLGEDQYFIEYDLENSGPYPEPGLRILHVDKIELNAIPLSMAWYPQIGVERFLVLSNSEYKFRLVNDMTKMIRGTFLGPTFGSPVTNIKILTTTDEKTRSYIIFATEKEVGIQMIPLDGNPFKIVGMTGHHQKIIKMCISPCNKFLFTLGYNDRCVLKWRINLRSVEVMARLGGEGIYPYFCLIEGGKKGWLANEMQDLFYYTQILHQGENITDTRTVSDKVSTKQLPNLMRSIGYYPTNEELESMMGEVSYKNYAETGELIEEINFEEFVQLYVNHRPVFGISMQQLKDAFRNLGNPKEIENPTLTRQAFLDVLFGKTGSGKSYGEPLSIEEAFTYLTALMPRDTKNKNKSMPKIFSKADFDFLPESISYKDFATDIMGIELPKERRADEGSA